jgi:hypothetical protein
MGNLVLIFSFINNFVFNSPSFFLYPVLGIRRRRLPGGAALIFHVTPF